MTWRAQGDETTISALIDQHRAGVFVKHNLTKARRRLDCISYA